MRGGGQIYAPGAVVPGPHNMIPYPAYAYGQMPVGGPPPGSPNSFTTARSHNSFVTAEGSRSSTRSRTRSRSRSSTLSRSSRSPPSPGAPGMFPGADSGYYPENQAPPGAEPPAGADSGYYPEANQGYFYQTNLKIRKTKKTKGVKAKKSTKGFKGTKTKGKKGTKGKRIKLKKTIYF